MHIQQKIRTFSKDYARSAKILKRIQKESFLKSWGMYKTSILSYQQFVTADSFLYNKRKFNVKNAEDDTPWLN